MQQPLPQAHLKNLHRPRVSEAHVVDTRFKPDPSWGAALKRLGELYEQQLRGVTSPEKKRGAEDKRSEVHSA
jgi:hypothetical protein